MLIVEHIVQNSGNTVMSSINIFEAFGPLGNKRLLK